MSQYYDQFTPDQLPVSACIFRQYIPQDVFAKNNISSHCFPHALTHSNVRFRKSKP